MIYKNVSQITINNTLDIAYKKDLDVIEKTGSLLDEYLIHNDTITFGKSRKAYKYIIFKERYLNEWSSCIDLILTNDNKHIEYFN